MDFDQCERLAPTSGQTKVTKPKPVPLACLPSIPGKSKFKTPSTDDPTPELPDDTPIENIRFATRLRNALAVEGLKTVGEVRETADETLLSFQDLGPELGHTHSRDIGPAVDRWGQAALAEWLRI